MRSILRLILGSVALGAVALGAVGCARKERAADRAASGQQRQPVEVVPVQRRDLVETLNLVGSLAPNESAQIRAEIAGPVRAIFFSEGETVQNGQVLLKIDDSELQAQLGQAEARFKLAELNLQRAENLRQTQTNTQADYDRARSEFASGKAELALLRVRLAKTEIKAPFAGVAAGRSVSPGDYVDATSVITKINDLGRMKIDFQVPERFLGKLQVGAKFTVKSKALVTDAPVQGEVYFVNAVIDRDTRSCEVKGYLDNPPPALRAGMFANIELVLDVRRGVLTVPEGAILVSPQGAQLITVQEKDGEKVAAFLPVKLGLRARGLVEVAPLKGELPEKQLVVASGVGGLVIFPGARLEPRPLREEFRVGE
jgi:membrane fusion protein (multidrug efflux system)